LFDAFRWIIRALDDGFGGIADGDLTHDGCRSVVEDACVVRVSLYDENCPVTTLPAVD
jgi:hypothetical protein